MINLIFFLINSCRIKDGEEEEKEEIEETERSQNSFENCFRFLF